MTGQDISQGHGAIVAGDQHPAPARLRRSSFRRSAQGREVVIVLGMHRSGTSLLANVLHLLGVDMLDQPTHVSAKNQTGFWERQDIVALHEEILSVLNVPIGSPAHAMPFASGWWRSPEIRPQKKKLRDLVAEHLGQVRRPWGFKDPRTCRLLPLWGEILEELDVSPRFVWAARHPAESALSMSQKNPALRPLSVAQSEVMWLAYNYDILRYAGRHWPIIVPYDAWFDDPLALAGELCRELDLLWQGSDDELEQALAALINREHRHHWARDHKLRCNVGLAEDLYRGILRIRSEPGVETGEAALPPLQSLFGAIQPFANEAREVKPLRDENQRLASNAEDLRTALEVSAKAIESLRESQNAADAHAQSLSDDVSRASAELSRLTAVRAADEAQLLSLRSENQRLRNDLRVAEQDHQALVGRSAATLAALGSERDALLAALATANAGLETGKSHALQLESALATATAERDSLQASLKANTKKLDSFRQQLSAGGAAQEELRNRLSAAGEDRQKLQDELALAAVRQEQLQSALTTAAQQHEALLAQQDSRAAAHQALQTDLAAAHKKLDAFRGLLSAATTAQKTLQARLSEASGERDAARNELAAAAAVQVDLKKELSLAARKLDSYRIQLTEAAADRDDLQAQLHRLSGEREALSTELSGWQNSLLVLQSAHAELKVRNDALLGEMSASTTILQSLASAGAALSAERDGLRDDLRSAAVAQEALYTEHLDLAADRNRLQAMLATANASLEALEKVRAELAAEVQTLHASLAISREGYGALSAEHLALSGERDGLLADLAAARSASAAIIESMHAELQTAKTAAAAQVEANATLRQDIGKLKYDVSALRKSLREERERNAEALHGPPGAAVTNRAGAAGGHERL